MSRQNDVPGNGGGFWTQQSHFLNNLLNASPDRIYFKDRESRFIRINHATALVFSLSTPEEAVGRTDADFFGEEHARAALEDERHVIATGEALLGKQEKETWPDGRITWASSSKSAMRDNAGNIIGIIGISRDITELKQIESSLRESEALFRTISEASPLGIILTDQNTATVYANEAHRQMCGRTSEELAGTGWQVAIHPEDRERIIRQWEEIKRTQKPFRSERRYLHKDGKIIWASMIAAPIMRKEIGKMVVGGYLGMVEDITERKQMQEQMLRSQRMDSIGTLAGGIAHDLNNILAPIVMASHLLSGGSEDEQRMVESVRASAKRAADLVKQLLSFARGGEGSRMEMDPTHLMRETEKIMQETFPKNIRITSRVPPNLWRLVADPTQIQQVLMNLCLNARDAMPGGGTLTLGAHNMEINNQFASANLPVKPGSYVEITVDDTGTGMPSEIKDRIFDPFFTTKQIGEGTGLGLSTALGILKSHGGFIDVKSEPGKGSAFSVLLPANGAAPPPVEEKKETPLPPGRGELVLFVDDEPEVVAMAQRSLKMSGYRVITSGNGKEAVEQYLRHGDEIAVVITDMMMPVIDGIATIQALVKIKPEIKIIATTGMAADAQVTAATKAGAKYFLAKPYTPKAMMDLLHEVLGQ